jgi:hypothetical protein
VCLKVEAGIRETERERERERRERERERERERGREREGDRKREMIYPSISSFHHCTYFHFAYIVFHSLQDSSQIYLIRTFIMKAGELTPLVSFF